MVPSPILCHTFNAMEAMEGIFCQIWQRTCISNKNGGLVRFYPKLFLYFAADLLKELHSGSKLKKADFFKTLRIAMTGNPVGTPVYILFDLLSTEEIVQRCKRACDWIDKVESKV